MSTVKFAPDAADNATTRTSRCPQLPSDGMRRRKREYQAQQAMQDANTFMATGWIEDVLMNAKEGAFQAFGWRTAPTDGVGFFPTDGSRANVVYPFTAFDWVQLEPRTEMDEAVIANHAHIFSVSDSPSHLVGYITRPNSPSSELFVILPMQGASEQWIDLFKRAGVKVLPPVEWAQWDTADWSQDQRDQLTASLEAGNVPHRWRGTMLQSGKQNEQAVLNVFSDLGLA